MNRSILLAATLFVAAISSVTAAVSVVDSNYSVASYYTDSSGNSIVSFDWTGSGDIVYMTSDSSSAFAGVYRYSSGSVSTVAAGNSSYFSGASVVASGSYVYYNNSDWSNNQYIWKYGPTTSAASVSQASTAANYGLYSYGGGLFITGSVGWGTNHIYYSALQANGSLGSVLDLGVTSGASGPLAFDSAGNLYYAPGYYDLSIYKWSAAEVASAIAGTSTLDVTGHVWTDYSAEYGSVGGATSMLFDENGNLLVTLTSFSSPSLLVSFSADGQDTSTILSDTDRLGELRTQDGDIYLAAGNQIVQVQATPEPSAALFVVAGVSALIVGRRMRRASVAILLAMGISFGFMTLSPARAGSYAAASNDPTNPYDAPIPGYTGTAGDGKVNSDVYSNPGNVVNPIFQGWATSVVEYSPAPGVNATWQDSSKALGTVTGDNSGVVSLGDLSSSQISSGVSPGHITLGFSQSIRNGTGADFAVFENSFISGGGAGVAGQVFAELGFVEVSTDGIHFARFPSLSLTPSAVGAYGTVDPTNVFNLAGKSVNNYGVSWGTPFDLDSLLTDTTALQLIADGYLDLDAINYVRIVDIPGSGDYLDSEGHPIYDAWQTYGSGGFDLDAVGAINVVPEPNSLALVAGSLGAWLVRRWRSGNDIA